jgi:glycosyltransferase involved in cell wall biosynthesis
MVAPNSDTVGGPLREALKQNADVLMAPSMWARGVLRKEFPEKEVVCVPHGISPAFATKLIHASDVFRVLHLSSSILARKGTAELLKGWARADLPNAQLFVSVPAGRLLDYLETAQDLGISDSVKITDRLDYTEEQFATLYSTMDFVCQPSRGEGFGFVPLEARACGTPVIMTSCTGHSQHFAGKGVVVVKTGEEARIDDFPGAHAPSLHERDVAAALTSAYQNRETLSADAKAEAPNIRKQWSWENQLKELKNGILSQSIRQ